MREKKKVPLKFIFLGVVILLVIGVNTHYVTQHSLFKDKPKEENKNTLNVDKQQESKSNDDKKDEEPKVEEKGEESINKDNESKVDNTPKTNNNSSSNQSSNNVTNNSNNKNTNNQNNNKTETVPKKETPVQEPPKKEELQPVVPSCTPKKFDMSFVRADFSSFGECTQMGDKYKAAGYGYFCDNYQDDCGTTYYMLTIYERNTGKEYDFHTIQLP